MNRNAIAVNGIGASRPDSFVNGTSAYVVEQGVESVLVTESPKTAVICSATAYRAWRTPRSIAGT